MKLAAQPGVPVPISAAIDALLNHGAALMATVEQLTEAFGS